MTSVSWLLRPGEPDVAEPAQDVSVMDMMSGLDPATAAVPQPLYRSLVETTPVMRIGESVILSRRAEVDAAFRCPEVFSSNSSAADLGNIRPLIPLQIDPPDHVRFRRLLDPLFAPRQMARLEPQIAALVHRLVDRFVDRGECDLVSEFTIPLPSEVFLTMFGLPLEELDTFLAMKDGIIRPAGAARRRAEREAPDDGGGDLRLLRSDPRGAGPRSPRRPAERIPHGRDRRSATDPRGHGGHLLPPHDRRAGHGHRLTRLLLLVPGPQRSGSPPGWSTTRR